MDVYKETVKGLKSETVPQQKTADRAIYYVNQPEALLCTSYVDNIAFGTGDQIYRTAILPAIRRAQNEVVLVTCFWARSTTLDALNDALRDLSATALDRRRTIRVRICFSSSSLWQKLLHPQSIGGKVWQPSTWVRKLGLPTASDLAGLDLEVKSIFLLPFSVMHPKFVIIDRQRVLLPSCNVSREDWFEGCINLSGPVTEQFVNFWLRFWTSEADRKQHTTSVDDPSTFPHGEHQSIESIVPGPLNETGVLSMFLPSPHHRFNFLWPFSSAPPPTPLNVFLLTLFARAERDIYIQTPNLTASPVLFALLAALKRGVNVTIITSRRLMILEQLVTAGTTTDRCVHQLIAQHKDLQRPKRATIDLETGLISSHLGNLQISYYRPRAGTVSDESTQSHLKLTIADGSIAVFGSGNMDRASWYTSQELGLALASGNMVHDVEVLLQQAMSGRSELVYDSSHEEVDTS